MPHRKTIARARARNQFAPGVRAAAVEALESRWLLAVNSTLVYPEASDGRLVYVPQADGDRIPDFSSVGYMTGNVTLPDMPGGVVVPVKQTINPGAPGVDMRVTIQNAINAVAALSPDANGFRGAIQLNAGNYPISGTLNINTSGIVLIGAGNDKNTGTRLEAIGTTASDARILISITGSGSRSTVSGTTHNIQNYVPVGATSFTVDSTSSLHVGDTVIVHRPSTTNWIHDIGMDTLTNPWTAGQRDINSDRIITAINGNTITIDAPITNSLDPNYGGGQIWRYTWSSRISQVGLMNMYTYSDWVGGPSQPDTDTTHATGIATLDKCVNCWVENLTADNFATNILNLGADTKWTTIDHVTIQNTSQAASNIADAPSGIGGTQGTLNLCSNITLTNAYHAISAGGNVAGPNVYTNVTITDPLEGALNLPHSRDETGPHQRYSTGGLFDDVSNTDWVNIRNAGNEGSGHGWQGANYVLWNVNARTDVSSPPTAQNWIIGGSGSTSEGTGIYDQRGQTVFPMSLYQTQLWDRLHVDPTVATAAAATPNPLNGSTSIALSVLGAESGLAESNLTYTWAVTSKPNGSSVTLGANGTNGAKNLSATVSTPGNYIFTVTIQDPGGLKATSTVVVTPSATDTLAGDRIVRNGSFIDVFSGATNILHQDYATSPEIVLQGTSGDDTITVDYSGGNPVPAAGLIVDGGGGTSDTLAVVGSSSSDAVTLSSGGSVSVNGAQFGYVNFEAMNVSLGGGSDVITASGDPSAAVASLALNISGGGSVAMASGSMLPTFTDLSVAGGATFDLAGQSQTIDALSGGGTVTDNGAAATLTIGQQNGSGSFAGILTNGSGALSLTKIGTGTLTLSGNNAYTGNTFISGGAIASGNSQSLALLTGTVYFNGGTFHVTADMTSANVSVKYSTSFAGATGSSTGTFDIDAGVTLTIGTASGSACLRTNGGGAHGGTFTKIGAGTIRILSNNGQLDDPFLLNAGTVIVESATGLGGADTSSNHVDMKNGTTLILRQDAATNFLTPINIVDSASTVNVVVDRQTGGAGVTHSINAISSVGAFTLNLSAGSSVSSGTQGLSIGTLTLGGNGTFNIGSGASMTITGSVNGAFTLGKAGGGLLVLNQSLTTASGVNITGGILQLAPSGSMHLIKTASLGISGGAKLDLTDNKLIVPGGLLGTWNGSAYTGISGLIQSGAIFTSQSSATGGNTLTTIGAALADQVGLVGATWGGQVVNSGDVLVMYTYAGDANLDGAITGDDYAQIDSAFPQSLRGYSNGDFNFDGIINGDDYFLIDSNFADQGQAIPT